jgi:organic hydroperoxide reductase OsmC/OhrA
MGPAAGKMRIKLPAETAIDTEVNLCMTDGAYFRQARLNVSLPSMDREVAQDLVDAGHQTCPNSKGMSSNIRVVVDLF